MMKIELLLLASVFGLFYYCFPVDCSEQQTLITDRNINDEKPLQERRIHEIESVLNEVDFISDEDNSLNIPDVTSVTASHHHDSDSLNPTKTVSESNVEVFHTKSVINLESLAACNGSGKLQQSRFSVNETEKSIQTNKDQTGKGTNASQILKKQFVKRDNSSPESDPSSLCKDQEIPTFDEWTKIMMEAENEKSKSKSQSISNGKKIKQTFTNYASVECGAKILSSNPEAKSTSAILMENMDMYMLNPCNNKIWFIIELCQPIQVRQLDIANFEIFSSNPKDFLVSVSDRYPTNRWLKLGTFHARDERTVHSFPLDEHLFAKYIKMELLSHFGSEHFCPLSMVRVFGTSMMEEYEMNSDSSDRPHFRDEQDDDESPDFVQLDDKSSKNLIGSAKDVFLTMVNNIAANVLGGNPDNAAEEEGNSSTGHSNTTEVPLQPIHNISSMAVSESVVADRLMNETTKTTSTSQETESTFTGDPVIHTEDVHIYTDIQKIVTLLPDDKDNESDQSSDEKLENNLLKCHVNISLRLSKSLEEYLLQRCSSKSPTQKKKKKKNPVSSLQTLTLLPQTKHFISTTTSKFTVQPSTTTEDLRFLEDSAPPDAEMSSLESMNLEPSLTSNFLKPSIRSQCFKVTHPTELGCSSFSECLKCESTDNLMKSSEKTQYTEQYIHENDLLAQVLSQPDHLVPQPSKKEVVTDEVLLAPTLDPKDRSLFEPNSKELFDNAIPETSSVIEQQVYTEMHNTSDGSMHGSNQKESVFMRLNNRIKILETNMSLSGRYLEQLSQRYRKQVEEMQRFFNQTIIKLQNTSRKAEEQDQKQTDSIETLQDQLENITRLLLGLSVSVNQLQMEVSERQSYIVLCLVLCVILGLLICLNHGQILDEAPPVDSKSSYHERNAVNYYKDVVLRRRASDPLSHSSFQITAGAEKSNSPKKSPHNMEEKPHLSSEKSTWSVMSSSSVISSEFSRCLVGSQSLNISSVNPGPLIVTRDDETLQSDDDENLFCGLSTCVSLCQALPAPKCWKEEKKHTQNDTRTSGEHLHQIPQCS